MSKTNRKLRKPLYTFEPWSVARRDGKYELEAYSLSAGRRAAIAEIYDGSNFPAPDLAEFILSAVNSFDKREHLINEMMAALEICLECEGLNWAAEHDAEIAVRHARLRS